METRIIPPPLKLDLQSAFLLMPIYSGNHGKITEIFKNVNNYLCLKEFGDRETADIFAELIVLGASHIIEIDRIIYRLGITPFLPEIHFSISKRKSLSPEKVLSDAIVFTLSEICFQEKVVSKIKDKDVKESLLKIVSQEKEKVDILKARLNFIKTKHA